MNPWVRFFIGTPQRLLVTLGALIVLASLADPSIPGRLMQGVVSALSPFLGIAMLVGIGWLAFRTILGGGRRH
ncbi:MAG: hypothetical protein ACM3NH_01815 [Candidatus Saccharibacteria bacterium]